MKQKRKGFDELGRNWWTDNVCIVDAICAVDGVIRPTFVKNGDFDKCDAYQEIDGVLCYGHISPLIGAHKYRGPFEFISEYHSDKAYEEAVAAGEYD